MSRITYDSCTSDGNKHTLLVNALSDDSFVEFVTTNEGAALERESVSALVAQLQAWLDGTDKPTD